MRKNLYMVVDTETATFDFAADIAQGNLEIKKKIALARPLVYDIGWTIMERNGNILSEKQYLIGEFFSNPRIFNTAYYASKRPIYMEMLRKKETKIRSWNEVMEEFVKDLDSVTAVGAFNSMFDFKKAIPFTEKYIEHLYSPDFLFWEETQYRVCELIASEPYKKKNGKEFDKDYFTFRGKKYFLFDIWGSACEILNNRNYKKMCLEQKLISNSGDFFETSAESSFRYLYRQPDFIESHTALDDARIESYVLAKCLKRKKVTQGITYFPFRQLGHPLEFALETKDPKKRKDNVNIVMEKMSAYVGDVSDPNRKLNNKQKAVLNKMLKVLSALEEEENEGD